MNDWVRLKAAMSQNHVQSIVRAFSILDLLRANNQNLGVSEIARALGLKTTTAYRLVQTLIACNAVQQDDNRHYHLAPNMLLYGKAVLDRYDFIGMAHPMLGELSKTVSETVFMGIMDDFELVYVDHVDSLDHNLRMTPQIGRRQAAHCTALGKMLLANLPPDELEVFLSCSELPSATEYTITDPNELRDALRVIREQGYAFDIEEAETGICCVAAPIVNLEGDVVAAISVSGPATRVKKKGLDTFLRSSVQSTAERISRLTII